MVPEKAAEDNPSSCGPATHVGDLSGVPGFSFCSIPDLFKWLFGELTNRWKILLSLPLYITLPLKELNNLLNRKYSREFLQRQIQCLWNYIAIIFWVVSYS